MVLAIYGVGELHRRSHYRNINWGIDKYMFLTIVATLPRNFL